MLKPVEPVSATARLLLGVAFFVLFAAVWWLATAPGLVSPTFLASPLQMAREGWLLLA